MSNHDLLQYCYVISEKNRHLSLFISLPSESIQSDKDNTNNNNLEFDFEYHQNHLQIKLNSEKIVKSVNIHDIDLPLYEKIMNSHINPINVFFSTPEGNILNHQKIDFVSNVVN